MGDVFSSSRICGDPVPEGQSVRNKIQMLPPIRKEIFFTCLPQAWIPWSYGSQVIVLRILQVPSKCRFRAPP